MSSKIIIIGLSIIFCVIISFFSLQIYQIKSNQKNDQITSLETKQFLLSTIDWSTNRQKLILFMRDNIVKENIRTGEKVDYNRAFEKANLIMNECERYPSLQPLFLLAVQRIESGFKDTIVSVAGAQGQWQFMPSTAKIMCNVLNVAYSEKAFYDPICTRLAGKYFDILKSCYSSDEEALADYNGGPYQAYYYKNDKSKLVIETANFVKNVINKNIEYTKAYESYKVDNKLISNPEIRPDSVAAAKKRMSAKKLALKD